MLTILNTCLFELNVKLLKIRKQTLEKDKEKKVHNIGSKFYKNS